MAAMLWGIGVSALFVAVIAQQGETPCDAQDPPPAETITFCQPKEEKGDYGVRYWQMDVDYMCRFASSGGCLTLDHMVCDGSPEWCLKWGDDGYAGRVLLPEGVRLKGYSDWDCTGRHWFAANGPTMQRPYDFWDYNVRVNSFKISMLPNFTCGGHGPRPKNPCVPDDIVGRWEYWFSQQSSAKFERSISVGLQTSESTTDKREYTKTFSEKVKAGIKVGTAEDATSSWSFELDASQSLGLSHSITDAIQRSTVETETKTLVGAGSYWQFVMFAQNTGSCQSTDSRALLMDYIRTPNAASPPCCPPGLFEDMDKPLGKCVPGAPRLCSRDPPAVGLLV